MSSRAGVVLSGMRWGAFGMAASVLAQIGLMACLSRLLTPADFGLMAMALIGLRFLDYFAQMGLGPALVQRPELSGQDIRLGLGLSLLVSGVCVGLTWLLAPLAARFFLRPDLAGILDVLALNFLLQGLSTVALALLRRGLQFRALALIDLAAYVIGYGAVGLALAWAGAGVWALVGATLAQSGLSLVLACSVARHDWRPSLRGDVRGLLGYGAPHSLVSFVEFLSFNVDTTLIGRLLGDAPLGTYSRARLLTNLPTEKVAGILGRVLFPLFSSAQAQREQVGQGFLLGVLGIGLAGAALSLGMAAAAGPLVAVMLGPQWQDAVPLVGALALCVPFLYMCHVAGVVCDALALLRPKLLLQGTALVLLMGAVWLALPRGMTAVVWAVLAVEALRWLAFLVLLVPVLQLRWREVARVHLAVAGMGGLVWVGVRTALAWQDGTPGAGLAIAVLAGALSGLLALGLARPLLRPIAAYGLLRSRVPALARWW